MADPGLILVFDLGGGTFDVSILEHNSTSGVMTLDVKACTGDAFLGGDDIDNLMMRDCVRVLTEKAGREPNAHEKLRLKSECKKAKEYLSQRASVSR